MKKLLTSVFMTLLLSVTSAFAALEDVTVMALGALDGRAVVKTTDGRMKVLKVGDTVPGSGAKVKQILNDRLVVEEVVTIKGNNDQEEKQKQTVWIYKPAAPGGASRIQRLDAKGPEQRFEKPVNQRLRIGEDRQSN